MKFTASLKFLPTLIIFGVFMARNYWYIIRVDGKEVWRGKKPQNRYWDLKKKNPNKKVSIAWQSDDDLLVVFVG